MPQEQVAAAARASVTALLHARRGTWDATSDAKRTRGGHGLLVLDGLLVRRLGFGDRWAAELLGPDVGIRLTARAMLRARRLANTFAIAQQSRLDARLHLLLWELADRYGRMHPDGVHLDLPLTHELLSHIAAARRPSVTSALARLADSGLAERSDTGWLLRGDPPTTSTWKPIRRPPSAGH